MRSSRSSRRRGVAGAGAAALAGTGASSSASASSSGSQCWHSPSHFAGASCSACSSGIESVYLKKKLAVTVVFVVVVDRGVEEQEQQQ